MLQHLLCTTAESKRLPGVWWVCQGQGGCPHAESFNHSLWTSHQFPSVLTPWALHVHGLGACVLG